MEIKKEKKVVEVTETTYVAVDGTEFPTDKECLAYEAKLELQKKIEVVEQFRIQKLDGWMPLTADEVNENNAFRWYKISNADEFKALQDAYGIRFKEQPCFKEPKSYPELICVETCGYEPYSDYAYNYNLSDLMGETKNFWETLGYKVTLEKQEDITREN